MASQCSPHGYVTTRTPLVGPLLLIRQWGMNDTNILFRLVWTAGASMREIGLCQISLPPCGLCFSKVGGEEENKVYAVSNVSEKNTIA